MNTYKLHLQYDGTNYCGWQIQPDQKTVQGELNKVISKMNKSEIRTIGSGRTDSGVHALDQVVKVEMPLQIDCSAFMKGLNSQLPKDIRVKLCEEVDQDFHPIGRAKSKEYRYMFSNVDNPLIYKQVTHYPFDLDFELMQKACTLFVGEFDFKNYQCTGTDVESTVREIFSCEIVSKNFNELTFADQNIFELRVVGSGFLKQMVRLIMGTIWSVGRKKISLQMVENSLRNPDGNKLAPVAPPQGLYLYQVKLNS